MTIKNSPLHVSLDNIYNQLIKLSASIEECRSSIEYIKIKTDKISDKVDDLSEEDIKRDQRTKILWGILQFSPGVIFKILSTIGIAILFITMPSIPAIKTVIQNYLMVK